MKEKGVTIITGATGFLGSHLLASLCKNSEPVVVLKRSTSKLDRLLPYLDKIFHYDLDTVSLSKVFEKHPVRRIIHCATNYGRRNTNPGEIVEANLILPLRLLELCPKYQVTQFINTDTILDKRMNFYSLSKKQFVEWLKTFSSLLTCINVSLEHFYGPMDDPSKFVTFVIRELLKKAPSLDFTPGEQKRDFIYIDDVLSAFQSIFAFSDSKTSGYHEFQVGSGSTISIREFVHLARSLSQNENTRLNFGALDYRENEVMESQVDTSHLKSLGWAPKTPLLEGLKKTILMERELEFL